MFVLFYNLYLAMFEGSWNNYTWTQMVAKVQEPLNNLGTFLTSIFGDNQMNTLGTALLAGNNSTQGLLSLVSLVLALITSIGIVVMAVKGVKKAFGIFFMGINRL